MPGIVAPTQVSSAQSTMSPYHDEEQVWQVFFLPKDDPAVPTSFIAFCPFTGVCAEGNTETEAAVNWKEEAKRQFNCYFYLPELHTTRKVWYGEAQTSSPADHPLFPLAPTSPKPPSESNQLPQKSSPSSPSLSFYVIDNYDDKDQAIAISPQSKDVIVGKGVEELSEVDHLPHCWSDWRVSCTPLLHRNWFFSLTPHCINW